MVRPDLGTFVHSIGLTRAGDLLYAQRTAAVSVHTAEVDFTTGRLVKSPSAVMETYLRGQEGRRGRGMGSSSPGPHRRLWDSDKWA
jgi:hypothetical protein